jgi:hypothetical protein
MTEATLSMVLKLLFNYKNKLFTTNKIQIRHRPKPTPRNDKTQRVARQRRNGQQTNHGGGERKKREKITKEYTVYELYGVSALDQYPFYHNTQFLIHSYCYIVAEYYSSIINNANANEDLTAALTPLSDINKLLLRITPYTITTQTYIRQPSSNNTRY